MNHKKLPQHMLNGLKTSKSQNVIVNNDASSNSCIPSGVSHVSIFGLRLFKIFYLAWEKKPNMTYPDILWV